MAAHNNPVKPFVILFVLVVLSQICNAGQNHGYVLYGGQRLNKYDTMTYGNYTLEFEYKCRLVLSDTGRQIWTSNSPDDQRCTCMFEYYGDLAIYGQRSVIWSALKNGHPKGYYVLVLQKDRNLVIYGSALWKVHGKKAVNQMHATNLIANSNNERYVLYDGETLNPGESLKNGKYRLTMEKDCNLVLYEDDTPVWSSKTADINNNCICKLKSDGSLIVYKTWDVRPLWSALGNRSWRDEGHYVLVLNSNGDLILHDKPIWSSGTHIVKAMPALSVHNTTASVI